MHHTSVLTESEECQKANALGCLYRCTPLSEHWVFDPILAPVHQPVRMEQSDGRRLQYYLLRDWDSVGCRLDGWRISESSLLHADPQLVEIVSPKVWRCYMVQTALGPSQTKFGMLCWVFPASLYFVTIGESSSTLTTPVITTKFRPFETL